MDLGSTDDVLATLENFQKNYLKEQTDEQLKRIREVQNEVEEYKKDLRASKTTKSPSQQKKALDKILKKASQVSSKDIVEYDININLVNEDVDLSKTFNVERSGKGTLFIKQGKTKVELTREGNTFSEKITVNKPKPKNKPKNKKKGSKSPQQVVQQSFSFSKDRLTSQLNEEISKQQKLIVKDQDIKEVVAKIKGFKVKKDVYKYAIQIIAIKKTNLVAHLNGKQPNNTVTFFVDKLEEILQDSFSEETSKELNIQAQRAQQLIDNFKSKLGSLKDISESEKVFMGDVAIIVRETILSASKISSSVLKKASSLLSSSTLRNVVMGASGFNPIVGALYDMVEGGVNKLKDKLAEATDKNSIDKDLDDIFNFDDNERKREIQQRNNEINKINRQLKGDGGFGFKDDFDDFSSPMGGGFDNDVASSMFGDDFMDSFDNEPVVSSLEDLKNSQKEEIDILREIAGNVKENTESTDNIYDQNKEWKKDEILQMSRDRIKDENSTFDKVFSSEKSPVNEVKDNFLSKILTGGIGTLTGSFLTDMLGASFITKIIGMIIPTLSAVAIPLLVTAVGAYLTKTLVWDKKAEHAEKYGSTETSAFLADILTPLRVLANAFSFNAFGSAKDVAQKLDKTHELIRGGLDILFSKDGDSYQDRKLKRLQQDLDKENEKLTYAEEYYKANNYKETDKVGNDTLLGQRLKVAQLKKKVGNTNNDLYAMNNTKDKVRTVAKATGIKLSDSLIPSAMASVPKRNTISSSLPSNGLTSTIKDNDYKNLTPELRAQIERIANEEGVDPDLAIELIRQESSFKEGALGPMTKYGKAVGRTQLLESTAKEMGLDPYDPEQNLRGGMRYLKKQLEKYGNEEQALSAYNSGPGNTDKAIKKGHKISQYEETRDYVAKITSRVEQRRDARETKLANAGKEKNTQLAMNGSGTTIINAPSNNVASGGGSTRSGTQLQSRNTESAYVNLQNSMYRGTPMG